MTPDRLDSWLPTVTGYVLLTLIVYAVVVAPVFHVDINPATIAALVTLFTGTKATEAWKKLKRNEPEPTTTRLPPSSSAPTDQP